MSEPETPRHDRQELYDAIHRKVNGTSEPLDSVRALHKPLREGDGYTAVCSGLCYRPGAGYDDYGCEADWPCPTAAIVYSEAEILVERIKDDELRAYWEADERKRDVLYALGRAERERVEAERSARSLALTLRLLEAWRDGTLEQPGKFLPHDVAEFKRVVVYR